MHLKFYLNKYVKADGLENYSLNCLMTLRKEYETFLDLTGGYDPDFPNINIGGRNGEKKIAGKNKLQAEQEFNEYNGGEDFPEDSIPYESEEILNLHK